MNLRPIPLKLLLLPIWNGGYRLAWRLGEYAGAVRHRRFGLCAVCGRFGPRLYRRWVVPPRLEELWGLTPELAEALARKESSDCFACGAKLRARRLARVLLDLYPVGNPPAPARSVRAWVRTADARTLCVAEINGIAGLHAELAALLHLAYSEFPDETAPGAIGADVRREDLTRLTYPDEAFDLVLTSETLEHVPDLPAALAEIRRILKPGGRHLFTVPLLPGVGATFARAVVRPDGSIEARAPRICHPGGDVGYPVFTEFGSDLPDILRRVGFDPVTIHFGPVRPGDLAQVVSCRKPLPPGSSR